MSQQKNSMCWTYFSSLAWNSAPTLKTQKYIKYLRTKVLVCLQLFKEYSPSVVSHGVETLTLWKAELVTLKHRKANRDSDRVLFWNARQDQKAVTWEFFFIFYLFKHLTKLFTISSFLSIIQISSDRWTHDFILYIFMTEPNI